MHQPKILYLVKLSFKREGKISSFSETQKRNLSPLPCLKSSKKFFREKGNEIDQTLGSM